MLAMWVHKRPYARIVKKTVRDQKTINIPESIKTPSKLLDGVFVCVVSLGSYEISSKENVMDHIHDWIVGDVVSNIDGTILWVCESCDIEPVTTTAPNPESLTPSKRDWMKQVISEVAVYPGKADYYGDYGKIEISFPYTSATIRPELSVFATRAVVKIHFDDPKEMNGFEQELGRSFANVKKR